MASPSHRCLNFPLDAVYPFMAKGKHGDKCDGAEHSFVIHFQKAAFRPSRASGR